MGCKTMTFAPYDQNHEDIEHLLLHCTSVGVYVFGELQSRATLVAWNIAESWEAMRRDVPRKTRSSLDTLFLLVTWHIADKPVAWW